MSPRSGRPVNAGFKRCVRAQSSLLERAKRMAKAREWGEEAIEVNTAILESDPGQVPALTRRGRCYLEQGDLEAARKDYERALELDPANRIARNALAHIDRKIERPGSEVERSVAPNARTVYCWILAREDNSFARVGLAAVHADTGESAKARKLYEEVLEREPANPYALMGLGRVLYALDRPAQAAETFEKAAKFSEDRRSARDAVAELKKMRQVYRDREEVNKAEWIDSVLDRLPTE